MRKFLHSGIISFLIILFIQLWAFVALTLWLNEYSTYIVEVLYLLGAILVIYEINRPGEPSFKYTWIVLITVLPIFGGLLYIYTHLNVVTNSISKRTDIISEETKHYMLQDKNVLKEIENDCNMCGFSNYMYSCAGYPTYKNTSVKYFSLGEDKFERMKEEIEKAEKFIFMEYFIVNVKSTMWLEILEILKRKAAEGVEIRFMYDAMGSLTMFPPDYCEELGKMGIKCKIFKRVTPFLSTYQNNRDHRKILVIDGHTAFTGGINISDEYINREVRFGHWKDTAVMVKGAAAVSFTVMFLRMWNVAEKENENYDKYIAETNVEAEGYVIPYSDSPIDDEFVGERVYLDVINRASEYVHIMTPYLVISYEMQEALEYAAKRGVDVRIIMPHIPDKPYALWLARSYYPKLIKAGVKIFEYDKGFVHAKVTTSDDCKSVVGTINYDYRSLYQNYECALFMYKVPEIADIESDYQNTEKMCSEITMSKYKKFNIFGRIFGMCIRLFAPLV